MSTVLTLICQGETAANRCSRFPLNDPLEQRTLPQISQLRRALANYQSVWCAPQQVARQTAAALYLIAEIDDTLAEIGYGDWAGLSLKAVMTQQPLAFAAWIQGSPPPGGEPIDQLVKRCGCWLEQRKEGRGNECVVVSAAVIRAMILNVLDAPVQAFALFDIHPLSISELCSDGRRWHICKLGG